MWDVAYDALGIPGAKRPPSWLDGSNCQRYAYGVLELFGRPCPPLRSAELWADTTATSVVTAPEPLDLVLFNATADPFGAHVGIWMADNCVLHLSREVGHPISWTLADFARRARYATTIGCKRVACRR